MKLTAERHVVPRLSMSGAMPLLPPCAFKACIWTTLPFPLLLSIISLWKVGGGVISCRLGSFIVFSERHISCSMAKSERRCRAVNIIIKIKNVTSNKKY